MARPKIIVTDDLRRIVKGLSAYGMSHEKIALKVGLSSPKTLRKHFRKELDYGPIDANLLVGQTLFRHAISGKCLAATKFWLTMRAHWTTQPKGDVTYREPPPFIVAKEERRGDEEKEEEGSDEDLD
jgi:hypothetical protein